MIRYLDVVPMLRAACPSFGWSSHGASAEPESGEFLHASHFAGHLHALAGQNRTECFPTVFDVIERVLTEGDIEARRLVEGGLLDDLANPWLDDHRVASFWVFEPWLGPLALQVPAVAEALEAAEAGSDHGLDESSS